MQRCACARRQLRPGRAPARSRSSPSRSAAGAAPRSRRPRRPGACSSRSQPRGDDAGARRCAAAAAASLAAADGLRRDGAQVPQIGLVSVRPRAGTTPARARRARCAAAPGVAARRGRAPLRAARRPERPGADARSRPRPGRRRARRLQWWAARLGLPAAWDIDARRRRARSRSSTPASTPAHPDLAGKIAETVDNDAIASARPGDRRRERPRHARRLAGLRAPATTASASSARPRTAGCSSSRPTSPTGPSRARSSPRPTRGARRDQHELRHRRHDAAPREAIVDAIDYAVAHDVVLVAAAADAPVEEQGDPANLLQPTGTGADITAGHGPVVTAATNADAARLVRGPRHADLARRLRRRSPTRPGPPACSAPSPATTPSSRRRRRAVRRSRAAPAARRSTATTATPTSRARRWRRRWSPRSPRSCKHFNPDLRAADVVRLLKETASRPAGTGWTPELGWGIVDAGRGAHRRAAHRPPRAVIEGRAGRRPCAGARRSPCASRAATSRRGGDRRLRHRPLRALALDQRLALPAHQVRRARRACEVRVRRGSRYRFYSIAVDRAGNREAIPPRAGRLLPRGRAPRR